MDIHPKDIPERSSKTMRPTERDLSKRHSAGRQEQAQRRYSIAQATIRAVPTSWDDTGAVMNGSRMSEVGSAPSASSALPPRPPVMTEIKSLDVPKMTAIKSLESLPPEELALDITPEISPRARYVRSRTKTMEERPNLPPCQAFTVKSGDANLTQGLKFTTTPIQGATVVDPSVVPPARMATKLPHTGPEPRRLRRTRQRSVNMPVSANPTSAAADAAIIKVGRLLCWGTGVASSLHPPRPKGRSSSRRAKTGPDVWQGISAVLRENGELKLFDAAEVSLVAVIRLSQLSRRAIQQLHASVLDERFCIAIYPRHAIGRGAMSSARPLYLALESRLQFETWWALLRAFAMPELYGPDQTSIQELLDADQGGVYIRRPATRDIFRLERSIFLRIIEVKLRPARPRTVPEKRSAHHSAMSAKEDPREKYFNEILMDGVTRARTVPRDDTDNLFWREDFDFAELPRSLSALTIVLKRETATSAAGKATLEDPATLAREGSGIAVCGQLELDFDTAHRNNDLEVWRPIMDSQRQVVGEMLFRAHADELVVLMLHEYQPLSEVIHRFSTNVPAQITRTIPRKLQLLSEVFINIFQVSARLDEWLMVLSESEIEAAFTKTTTTNERSLSRIDSDRSEDNPGERDLLTHELGKTVTTQVNLLFRGNSLLTRSMDLYMRRVGKEYLEETLRDVVLEINASEADCEVDPTRVQPPSADLTKHWSSLVRCFRMVWTAIRESVTRCPREMRLLLRHIRACCDERFGPYHHTVRYSSVSGFLFLRFFCPAVLNPKIFGLLPGEFLGDLDSLQ